MGLGIDTSSSPLSVITGATSGLGSALVDICAREGHYIIGAGRREKELASMVERALDLGAAGVVPVQADLATIEGRVAVIEAAANNPSTPRYLFNIAGTYVSDAEIAAEPSKRRTSPAAPSRARPSPVSASCSTCCWPRALNCASAVSSTAPPNPSSTRCSTWWHWARWPTW